MLLFPSGIGLPMFVDYVKVISIYSIFMNVVHFIENKFFIYAFSHRFVNSSEK